MRPTWDEFYLQLAAFMATRSTCLKHQVGAVLVRDRQVLSTGYNGAPSDLPHCEELGCARAGLESGERLDLCRAVHAEQNAIIQAALHGVSTKGATLYTTAAPCYQCAAMIINAGIARVVSSAEYPNDRFANSKTLLAKVLAIK